MESGTFLRRNGIATHFFREWEAEELFCDLRPVSVEECRWSMRIIELICCAARCRQSLKRIEASLDLRS